MRTRDDEKQAALFEATVKLVNEIGFVASSVSKIANEAKVSPATIYVYHQNKEDLLVSTYVEIKLNLSRAILADFDDTLPIRSRWASSSRAYSRFASRLPRFEPRLR